MGKEKTTVSACPCSRALKLIMCADCGVTFTGRLQVECKAHPRALFLQDVSACTSCKQSDLFKLMEFDLPAGMIVFGMSLLFIMSFTQGWRKHSRNSETEVVK